jgi:hypothetical protein
MAPPPEVLIKGFRAVLAYLKARHGVRRRSPLRTTPAHADALSLSLSPPCVSVCMGAPAARRHPKHSRDQRSLSACVRRCARVWVRVRLRVRYCVQIGKGSGVAADPARRGTHPRRLHSQVHAGCSVCVVGTPAAWCARVPSLQDTRTPWPPLVRSLCTLAAPTRHACARPGPTATHLLARVH